MEIKQVIKVLERRLNYWADGDDPDATSDDVMEPMAAYETAIETLKLKASGRLVELPLALGDKAYFMPDYESWRAYYTSEDECIFEETVSGIAMREDGFYINCEEDDDTVWNKLGTFGALATLEDAQKTLEQYKKRAWLEGRDDT